MLTAIQIGADPVLLRTREAVLESAGLRVVSVDSASQAVEILWSVRFDLVVLCHSLSRGDRIKLNAAIRRRNPSASILLVSAGSADHMAENDGIDAILDPEPPRLLDRLRLILLSLRKDGAAARSEEAGQA